MTHEKDACNMDSEFFEHWFENCLLKEAKCGSTIVLDNARFHRKSVLPELAKRKNCHVLFLPPYSPHLNPIEKKCAWLKGKLREVFTLFDSLEEAIDYVFQVG